MLRIINKNKEYEIEFNGIKIFLSQNPTLLYKELFIDSNIQINDINIKNENIIYINELTKLNEFVNFSKKSFLIKEIFQLLDQYPIINKENLESIVSKINEKSNFEIIDSFEGDQVKIISLLVELINNDYLNLKTFKFLCNYIFEEPRIFILDNVSWIDLETLKEYMNIHSFILITNNIPTRCLTNISDIELIVSFNEEYNYFDILDYQSLLNYLEKEMNIEINEQSFLSIIKEKNTENYLKIVNFLLNICEKY